MGYRIRQIEPESQFCQTVSVDVISDVIGLETMQAVLDGNEKGEQQVRKLPSLLVLLLCIMMNLLSELSLTYVLVRLVKGTRFLCDVRVEDLAKKSAISRARYRLGAKVMQYLFKRVCRPIATEQTKGAFAYGLRLVAIDGTVENMADTPDNEAFFGRHHASRGAAAFPQVKAVYLCECGTHAIFDASFLPCHTSEHHVTELVNVPVFNHWSSYLWQAGQSTMLLRKTRSNDCLKLWTVDLDVDSWTRIITGGLSEGVIQLLQS